jgi:crotonobetainyl-CoA:carnitine CoA-transferase CaiB-like acyl-CoA transferase
MSNKHFYNLLQKLIHKLVEKSDVFVENFKTGGLAKYNLDYQTLSRVNPRLIYCSITGFGQTGPRKNEPGYDFIIQGMGGLMSITGERNGPPVKVGVAVTDIMTGLYASNAILAALYHRNNSGQGQHIDMALFDTQVAYLGSISARILRHVCWYRFSFSLIGWQYDTANQGLNYLTSGVAPTRMGNEHPNIVPYSVLTTSDGHLIVSVGNESQYSKFCTAIGREDLKQDPRFVTNNLRVQNRDAMFVRHRCLVVKTGSLTQCGGLFHLCRYAELNKVFAAKPKSHWIQILNQIQVSVSPINNIDEVFQEAQTHARDMKITMTRPSGASSFEYPRTRTAACNSLELKCAVMSSSQA